MQHIHHMKMGAGGKSDRVRLDAPRGEIGG